MAIKTLSPIKVNAGLVNEYSSILKALVKRMNDDVEKEIITTYSENYNKIVGDSSPVKSLVEILNELFVLWEKRFIKLSNKLPKEITNQIAIGVNSKINSQIKREMKDITVSLRISARQRQVLQAVIQSNVDLIRSIPEKYFEKIRFKTMEAVEIGLDRKSLKEFLQENYNVTSERANLIANDQIKKATSFLTRSKYQELGIKQAIWVHPNGISKEPRESHLKANGKKFNLDKGMYIDGEYIYPKQKINCNCDYRPVIAEFEDEKE